MNATQTEAFPEEKRRRDLRYSIPQAYAAAAAGLPKIGESSKVFQSFSTFAKNLNAEKDAQTILGNLEVVREKAGDVIGAIDFVKNQIAKAVELEEEMHEVEEKLGIPLSERWKARPEDYDKYDSPWSEKFTERHGDRWADDEDFDDEEGEADSEGAESSAETETGEEEESSDSEGGDDEEESASEADNSSVVVKSPSGEEVIRRRAGKGSEDEAPLEADPDSDIEERD